MTAKTNINTRLEQSLVDKQETQRQIKEQHTQNELDTDAKRAKWNKTRNSLEQLLSTAVAAMKDETKTSESIDQMEHICDDKQYQ